MEFKCGDLFIRENPVLSPGERVKRHRHNFDHMLQILRGKAIVRTWWPDGKTTEREVEFPWYGNVPAEVEHEIECIEGPLVSWCVFPNRDWDGKVIGRYAGNYAATI